MKEIRFSKNFKKNYNKRIVANKKLEDQFEKRIDLFQLNSKEPILKDHALKGTMKPKRSFSIAGDIRVIYLEYKNYYFFLDIGSYNQVY